MLLFVHRVSNIFRMLVIIAIHSGRTSAAGILNLVLMNSRSTQSVRYYKTSSFVDIKHLMTGAEGNSKFCFPRISMFLETKSRETLRFEGNQIHCSPRDQSLSDLLYSKTKQKQNLKTALRFQPSRATAVTFEMPDQCEI